MKSANGVVLSDFSRALLNLKIDKTIAGSANSVLVQETLVTDMDFWVSHSRPLWDNDFTDDPFCDPYDFEKEDPWGSALHETNSNYIKIIESLYPERYRGRVTPNLQVELTLSPADKELYESGI